MIESFWGQVQTELLGLPSRWSASAGEPVRAPTTAGFDSRRAWQVIRLAGPAKREEAAV